MKTQETLRNKIMQGFFTRAETQSKSRPDGKTYSCPSCGLLRPGVNPGDSVTGNPNPKILLLNSTPASNGNTWEYSKEKLLTKILGHFDIELNECLSATIVACPTKELKEYQIDCCRKRIVKLIESAKPNVIITFGMEALYSLIGKRWQKDLGDINKWRGYQIPDEDFDCYICPTYSLDSISENDIVKMYFMRDIGSAVELSNKPKPTKSKFSIDIISDLSVLENITSRICAFDYETTGIKPHAEGHKIICASIADTPDHAYAFMMPEKRKELRPFLNFLANKKIRKMAHNMKYEETWSAYRLRQPVQGWYWDSMLAAHILDNREGICGLKFQTYINFGVVDYDSDVAPFLKSAEKKDGNAFNKLIEPDVVAKIKDKLLTYCAMDSIYQYRLAQLQIKKFTDNE